MKIQRHDTYYELPKINIINRFAETFTNYHLDYCFKIYNYLWNHKKVMSQKIVPICGMTITIALFFASGTTFGNQQAIAFVGIGHGFGPWFGHFHGPFFGHLYRPGFGYYYSPGYVIDNPCGGGPYSIIDGQVVCTIG